MAITTANLAKLAGISRATVDRVLNNRGGVKLETEETILRLAKEHGYRPNHSARSLSTGKTNSIGIVIPNLRNSFFANLLDVITVAAHELQYSTLVQIYQDTPENETECVYNLYDRNVDGIILLSMQEEKESIKLFDSLKIPVVTLCNSIEGYTCIRPNYKLAMYDATNYIISHGYKKIIYVSPPLQYMETQNMNSMKDRYDGFLEGIKKISEYKTLITTDYLTQLSNMSNDELQSSAILCSNDMYAIRVLNHFFDRGIKIPKDIGLMGFDNLELLEYIKPKITTTGVSIEEMGQKSVEAIIGIIRDTPVAKEIVLPHTIKLGQTIIQI